MASSQRLVKWTESYGKHWTDPSGEMKSYNDLNLGEVAFVDTDSLPPELTAAITKDGKLGRVLSHSHAVVNNLRIWTLVVEFD